MYLYRIDYNTISCTLWWAISFITKSVPQTETSYSEVENVTKWTRVSSNSASSHIIHILQSYKLCSNSVRSGINSEMW